MWAIGLNNLQIAGALLLHFTCKLLMEGSLKIHVNTLKIIYCLIYLHDYIYIWIYHTQLLWWLSSKETACNAGDTGSIPGSERSPGVGNGDPLHILAWKIPWAEDSGGLLFKGSQRVGHTYYTQDLGGVKINLNWVSPGDLDSRVKSINLKNFFKSVLWGKMPHNKEKVDGVTTPPI